MSAILCAVPPARLRSSLDLAMQQFGYARSMGVAHDPADTQRDPHDRGRRFFRVLPAGGAWTALLERDTPTAPDYLLAQALAALGAAPVVYVSLAPDRRSGVVSRMEGPDDTQDAFLQDGRVEPDVSSLPVPESGPDALLVAWDVDADGLPDFEQASGPPECYQRRETGPAQPRP